MIRCIRFFFANFFFIRGILLAFESSLPFPVDEKTPYQIFLSMKSEFQSEGHSTSMTGTQLLKGDLQILEEWRGIFPLEMEFVLKEAEFVIFDRLHRKQFSLETPAIHAEINELRGFKGQKIPFSLTHQPPFIQFSENFLKKHGELKIFRYPLFAGFLGEYLFTLFEISRHPFKVGEGFEIVIERGEGKPYQSTKTCVIKEMREEFVTLEVTTIVDRQKIYLSPLEPAVVTEQTKGIWTIDRSNGLRFTVMEKGEICQMIRLNQVEVLQKSLVERNIKSGGAD